MPQRLTPSVHSKSDGGALPHQAAREHAGVVAQHVDGAERLVRVLGQRVDVVEVATRRRRTCWCARAGTVSASAAGLDVGRDDAHAVRRERLGEGPPDAAARAR